MGPPSCLPTPDGMRADYSSAAPSQLVLSAEPEPLRVAATTIDTLWVKRGSAGRGAGIGALMGLVGGGIAGAVACADCQDTPPSALVVGGALIGAAIGALVGAGIGAVSKHWVRQYPK